MKRNWLIAQETLAPGPRRRNPDCPWGHRVDHRPCDQITLKILWNCQILWITWSRNSLSGRRILENAGWFHRAAQSGNQCSRPRHNNKSAFERNWQPRVPLCESRSRAFSSARDFLVVFWDATDYRIKSIRNSAMQIVRFMALLWFNVSNSVQISVDELAAAFSDTARSHGKYWMRFPAFH
jgi:hypothetical protein